MKCQIIDILPEISAAVNGEMDKNGIKKHEFVRKKPRKPIKSKVPIVLLPEFSIIKTSGNYTDFIEKGRSVHGLRKGESAPAWPVEGKN